MSVLNLFFVRALNNHLYNQPVIVGATNPRLCNSDIIKGNFFLKALSRPAEEGGRQLVWAAVGAPSGGEGSLDKLRGAYTGLADINEPSDFLLGEKGKQREDKLWVSYDHALIYGGSPQLTVCGLGRPYRGPQASGHTRERCRFTIPVCLGCGLWFLSLFDFFLATQVFHTTVSTTSFSV